MVYLSMLSPTPTEVWGWWGYSEGLTQPAINSPLYIEHFSGSHGMLIEK